MSVAGVFSTVEHLVLASASPRRRGFLDDLGLSFTVEAADIDETAAPGEVPSAFVQRIARAKGAVLADKYPHAWVLAADTAVVLGDDILGKPENAPAAMTMLQRLSGRWHEVWTGFCLCRKSAARSETHAVRTEVRFADLTEAVCRSYVQTGEPMDKAGAYGIQGKGGFLVQEIRGSYSNVVGLPLAEVIGALLRLKVILPGFPEGTAAGQP